MNIVSNFEDYYDYLSDKNSNLTYIRNMECTSRVEELAMLKRIGIKTIELKPVSQMMDADEVIVYTDLYKHNGKGKVVMSLDGAKLMYPTKLCSRVYKNSLKETYKLLKIGDRSFTCVIKNKENLVMSESEKDIHIKEISNLMIGISIPIFSIDYVKTDSGMIACDFNTVERLDKLYINKYIKANEVKKEIEKKILLG